MAQFAKSTFSHASYAAFRPSYPHSLYDTVLKYHQGTRNTCIDLGCGHGVITRYLAAFFDQVIGTDPSKGMIEQAKSGTSKEQYPGVKYIEAAAEDLPFAKNESVDLLVAGQASHWFDQSRLWPEVSRVLRSSGTVAFWGYKDHVFVDYPRATKVLNDYAYGTGERMLGHYWSQPGRSIVQNKLRDLQPPAEAFDDIQRIEYEPGTNGPRSGDGTMFINRNIMLGECMSYVRTWSAVSAWQDAHPDEVRRDAGGKGDVVDEMFDVMRMQEPDWQQEGWKSKNVEIEWGSGVLLARRKKSSVS